MEGMESSGVQGLVLFPAILAGTRHGQHIGRQALITPCVGNVGSLSLPFKSRSRYRQRGNWKAH